MNTLSPIDAEIRALGDMLRAAREVKLAREHFREASERYERARQAGQEATAATPESGARRHG
ncbi:MAG: hypothetical protein ACRD3Q_17395 [Terriglobales bacterium]